MDDNYLSTEDIAALCLIRSQNVGPVTYRQLLHKYRTAQEALLNLPHLARRGGSKSIKIYSRTEAEQEIESHRRHGSLLITHRNPLYPRLLWQIDDAPPVISFKGRTELLAKIARLPQVVAVVGTRNASLNGQMLAQQIAHDLGKAGWIIASGLARGIDTCAHQGSIKSGTIAVIAGGINIVYPPDNNKLYQVMSEEGAIISEAPFGTELQPRMFPRRNRIIAGMSKGVLVIEAALRSGSLITARCANEQGREVMAIPGSPLDPRARGSNALIKEGASLIESAEDVIENLTTKNQYLKDIKPYNFTEQNSHEEDKKWVNISEAESQKYQNNILSLLGPLPTAVDQILASSGLPIGFVMTLLLELELGGKIFRLNSQQVVRNMMDSANALAMEESVVYRQSNGF